jgi:hypothetical protein
VVGINLHGFDQLVNLVLVEDTQRRAVLERDPNRVLIDHLLQMHTKYRR